MGPKILIIGEEQTFFENGGFLKTRQLHNGRFGHIWSPLFSCLLKKLFDFFFLSNGLIFVLISHEL